MNEKEDWPDREADLVLEVKAKEIGRVVVRTVRLWRETRGNETRFWLRGDGKHPLSPDALKALKSLLPDDDPNDDWSFG